MSDPQATPQATLAAWREQGAHRLDPVRFGFIEAMARRAQAHQGEVRRILDEKLARLIEAYRASLESGRSPQEDGGGGAPRLPYEAQGTLAALLDHIARKTARDETSPAGAPDLGAPPELKTLRDFRSTWSRLSAEQRLKQSLAKVPDNAGPLNSNRLVHRALVLMQTVSPAYLQRFMSHVDTLSWLEQLNGGGLRGK